eukprot:154875-Rhodomonas_salina.1
MKNIGSGELQGFRQVSPVPLVGIPLHKLYVVLDSHGRNSYKAKARGGNSEAATVQGDEDGAVFKKKSSSTSSSTVTQAEKKFSIAVPGYPGSTTQSLGTTLEYSVK